MSFYMKLNCCYLLIHTYSYNMSQLNSGICRLAKLGHMLVTGYTKYPNVGSTLIINVTIRTVLKL